MDAGGACSRGGFASGERSAAARRPRQAPTLRDERIMLSSMLTISRSCSRISGYAAHGSRCRFWARRRAGLCRAGGNAPACGGTAGCKRADAAPGSHGTRDRPQQCACDVDDYLRAGVWTRLFDERKFLRRNRSRKPRPACGTIFWRLKPAGPSPTSIWPRIGALCEPVDQSRAQDAATVSRCR